MTRRIKKTIITALAVFGVMLLCIPKQEAVASIKLEDPVFTDYGVRNLESYWDVSYDTIWFGSYYIDDFTKTQKNSIRWLVLDVDGSKATLLSESVLDVKPFNEGDDSYDSLNIRWEGCTLRKWLNGYEGSGTDNFYDNAFSEKEKEALVKTKVKAEYYGYSYENNLVPGTLNNDTEDYVWIAGKEDISGQCWPDTSKSTNDTPTDTFFKISPYIMANFPRISGQMTRVVFPCAAEKNHNAPANVAGLYTPDRVNMPLYRAYDLTDGWWWDSSGKINQPAGIRPMITIDLSKTSVWTYAGKTTLHGMDDDGYDYSKMPVKVDWSKVDVKGSKGIEVSNGVLTGYDPDSEQPYGDEHVLIIPEGVTAIGDNFLKNCTEKLLYVFIPSSVEKIGTYGLAYNEGISSAYFYDSVNSKLKEIGDYAFYQYRDYCINIPDSVETIGESAFKNSKILSFRVPPKVDTINDSTFNYSRVQHVDLGDKIYKYIGDYAFSAEILDIEIPKCEVYGKWAFAEIPISDVVIDNIKDIPNGMFNRCFYLKNVTLGNSVESIGEDAFCDCKALENINFPSSLKTIGPRAFGDCLGFTEITWPSTVDVIPNNVFEACTNLSSVSMGNNVTSIGDQAFYKSGLSEITLSNKLETIGQSAFSMTNLRQIAFPDSVTSIGANALYKTTKLRTVTFGKNITTLPKYFMAQSGIVSLNLPDTITEIGEDCFYNCAKLREVKGKGVKVIGYGAFYECPGLDRMPLSESPVETVGERAFKYSSVTYADMSKWKIKSIPGEMFKECKSLKKVELPKEGLEQISSTAFDNSTLEGITLPEGIKEAPAFSCKFLKYYIMSESVETVHRQYQAFDNGLRFLYYPSKVVSEEGFSVNYKDNEDRYFVITNPNFNFTYKYTTEPSTFPKSMHVYAFFNDNLVSFAQKHGLDLHDLSKETPPGYEDLIPEIPDPRDYELEEDELIIEDVYNTGDYLCFGDVIGIYAPGTYKIRMRKDMAGKNTHEMIYIQYPGEGEINLILDNVNIYTDKNHKYDIQGFPYEGMPGILIKTRSDATVNIYFDGKNSIKGTNYFSGINKYSYDVDGTLNIMEYDNDGNNSLEVVGQGATGIGSFYDDGDNTVTTANVNIKSGSIKTNFGATGATGFVMDNGFLTAEYTGSFTMNGGTAVIDRLDEDCSVIYNGGNLYFKRAVNVTDSAGNPLKLVALPAKDGLNTILIDGNESKAFASAATNNQIYLFVSEDNHKVSVNDKEYEVSFEGGKPHTPGAPGVIYPEYMSEKIAQSWVKGMPTLIKLNESIDKALEAVYLEKESTRLVKNIDYKITYKVRNAYYTDVTIEGIGFYTGKVTIAVSMEQKKDDPKPNKPNNPTREPEVGDTFMAADGFYYKVTVKSKEVGVYNEPSGKTTISIPQSVTYGQYKYTVTSICRDCFYGNGSVETIIIPSTIKEIGSGAFQYCSSLKSIVVPGSVKTLEDYTFSGCHRLKTVTLSKGLTTIGARAFQFCEVLASVKIPDTVKTIGEYAFYDCYKLKTVTLGKGVTKIGTGAFYYCKALTKITIPSKVKTIGNYAFNYCTKLKTVSLGSAVTTLGDYAFYNCKALGKITIPSKVSKIGTNCFAYCSKLKTITIKSTKLYAKKVGYGAFSYINSKATVKVPKSKYSAYKSLLKNKGLNGKKQKIKK